MATKTLRLGDHMGVHDGIAAVGSAKPHKPGFWARTEILIGTGRHFNEKTGCSELEEVFHRAENMVLIGGVQYAMEKLFNITGYLDTGFLNTQEGLGSAQFTTPPEGLPYPPYHCICLFGCGTGGAGETNASVLDVNYNERSIIDMVPFRYTDEPLEGTDIGKYYGKKVIDGKTAYFFKVFDQTPVIRHLWRDGEEGEDGSEVDDTVFTDNTREDSIESFTEILLSITKKDMKEWFIDNGSIERSRVNSIALATGLYSNVDDDYEQIKLFSKLNIPTEYLVLNKELEIIYRVYGS